MNAPQQAHEQGHKPNGNARNLVHTQYHDANAIDKQTLHTSVSMNARQFVYRPMWPYNTGLLNDNDANNITKHKYDLASTEQIDAHEPHMSN